MGRRSGAFEARLSAVAVGDLREAEAIARRLLWRVGCGLWVGRVFRNVP